MKKLIVGGTFDDNNGKTSYIVKQLIDSLGTDWENVNGGNITYINTFDPTGIDVLLWMPNIANDEVKILDSLKIKNSHMLLIQSKRVIEKEYYPSDIVGRLLKSHSALGIMISKDETYRFRVLDPLGNLWCDTKDINIVGETIQNRIIYLLSLTRIGSKQMELSNVFSAPQKFIDIIKQYGNEFTKFVNAINPNRLLGNASTRCSSGFPAMRLDNHILVTKRNVDKTTLNIDDFVLVKNEINNIVYFSGNNKPSVDTPIQLRIFDYYKNINYIIHGHVYIKNGIFTTNKIPCGYIEEFEEIKSLFADKNLTNFSINLKGHGCLIMAENLDYLQSQIINLKERPFPESN
jgi:hypothetical protein